MTTAVAWQGEWIGVGDDTPAAPLLRREFEVPAGVSRGVLHVAGLGLHRTTIDGRPVSDAVLESGITDYGRRVVHSSYPVDLTAGRSVVGVELGRGFYALTTPNVWGWHEAPWLGPRMARVQLELLDDDGGTVAMLVSDTDWRWAPGGTRFDSLYEGETFDATLHPNGWDAPGYDASGWAPVVRCAPPSGTVVAQQHEPVRVVGDHPVRRWIGDGVGPAVADFGRQFAGWVQVSAPDVPAGTRITVSLAERADETGVRLENPHVGSDRLDVFDFVVSEDVRSWEPRFTWTGFRYAQVDGVDPDQVELVARHAHSDVAVASRFSCSDEVLTWIDTAMRSTVVNNLHHLPTDTPVYEKNGWTGDVHVALEAMLHQFQLRHLLIKWLDDIADGQQPDGQLPVIAPTPGWGYIEAPEWTTLYPHLLERLDTWYGIADVVARHRGAMIRYLRRELRRRDDDGLVSGVLGDYLAPGTDGSPPSDDPRLAASCYLVRGLRAGASMLERHGTDESDRGVAEEFTVAADRLAAAVNATFLDVAAGHYRSDRETGYRQTTNILPVAFGITPPEWVVPVVDRLAAEIGANGDRHDAGCLGLSELMGVLTRGGHAEVALRVATGTRAPSWGAWRAAGETTMQEMWGPLERSRNHFFMGAMSRWLYEEVAGVRMSAPQWAAFTVDPCARTGLDHAAFHYHGPHGELGASWTRDGDELCLEVVVPTGTTAQVRLSEETVEVGPGTWRWTVPDGAPATVPAAVAHGT